MVFFFGEKSVMEKAACFVVGADFSGASQTLLPNTTTFDG